MMTSILQKIAHHKYEEVKQAKTNNPLKDFIYPSEPRRDFVLHLKKSPSPAIIAEVKKASPSKGIIRTSFNVAEIATIYEQSGASCLSVLTDEHFFQGHSDYIRIAKTHCSIPILRKDFIIDSYQIYESLQLNADCILLVVALLDDVQLQDYCQLAQELRLAVLIESHTLGELERALCLDTPLIGINNRDLHTFKTDLQLSIDLRKYIPQDKIIITESGINTHQDIVLMQQHDINTFLIGESLMRAEDIGSLLKKLIKG